jgi:hypothetical protein
MLSSWHSFVSRELLTCLLPQLAPSSHDFNTTGLVCAKLMSFLQHYLQSHRDAAVVLLQPHERTLRGLCADPWRACHAASVLHMLSDPSATIENQHAAAQHSMLMQTKAQFRTALQARVTQPHLARSLSIACKDASNALDKLRKWSAFEPEVSGYVFMILLLMSCRRFF